MNKINQIYNLLLTPICCNKNYNGITCVHNRIYSGQKYYSTPDEDMSDFAIGFYEIIYKEILQSNPLLNEKGYLLNKEFAGDTMNSFNGVANITPGAGKSRKLRTSQENWPKYLIDYYNKYHCLANFWLLPAELGRTTKGELNKAKRPINDNMDRFLQMVYTKVKFTETSTEYFNCFNNWIDFVSKHFLINSYLNTDLEIDKYSDFTELKYEMFITKALEKMEKRATCIADSKYAGDLWEYFRKLCLV